MPALRLLLVAVALAGPIALTSCSKDGGGAKAPSASVAGPCPAAPLQVVVSVDQWGDIVSQLGGNCAQVKTLLAGSSVDPHDYEPSPSDAVAIRGAQLIVVNGAHYDQWATKLAAGAAPDAPLVDAAELSGQAKSINDEDDSVNPHLWYNPATVAVVADAVTAQLSKAAPQAADYFAAQRAALNTALAPYNDEITAIKARATGKSYAATEGVFDYMAGAIGLVNKTPDGYRTASSNETDPSPADLNAFLKLLGDKAVDVLIYNTQTEGSMPEQIRTAARGAGIPVVEVTETVAPGATSFQSWQLDQLRALAEAVGVQH